MHKKTYQLHPDSQGLRQLSRHNSQIMLPKEHSFTWQQLKRTRNHKLQLRIRRNPEIRTLRFVWKRNEGNPSCCGCRKGTLQKDTESVTQTRENTMTSHTLELQRTIISENTERPILECFLFLSCGNRDIVGTSILTMRRKQKIRKEQLTPHLKTGSPKSVFSQRLRDNLYAIADQQLYGKAREHSS